jgi:peptide/nickel transport system permease protein
VLRFLARRALTSALVFLLTSMGVFALVRRAPGDPVSMMISPEQMAGGSADFLARKRHELGLDQPLPLQYAAWLRRAATGDLGFSYTDHRAVTALLAERLPPTVELMGLALLVAVVLGVALGALGAVRRNTIWDVASTTVSLTGVSVPPFFLGIAAIYLFSLRWHLIPSSGMSTIGVRSTTDALRHLALPVLILGFATAGSLVRFVRSGLLGELHQDYVRTALAKGASPRRALWRHAFRNTLIPLITVVTLSLPTLLAGAVVIEQVFAWPGMGQLALGAIRSNDYPVVVGFAMYVSLIVLASNLLADILYAVADPRVRVS